MNALATRHTAQERRDEILDAAFDAFADTGLEGTSTEAIAHAAGISQPYLFRLFGTKKLLFLAAVERCFEQTITVFREAVDGGSPAEAKQRMGDAYVEMIRDRRKLRMQMQAYAACDDPDVRRVVQRGFEGLADYIRRTTNASPAELASFLAQGMLLNVLASMDVLDSTEPWAATIREGCMVQAH
ncbi:MAG: TetR/AcrR family transcriptional regulator [Candidatus Limnocylindrales bacterium]